jgi:hypothetical protein
VSGTRADVQPLLTQLTKELERVRALLENRARAPIRKKPGPRDVCVLT